MSELIKMRKPLESLDFCYIGESENITMQECISVCGMIAASKTEDSPRSTDMLTILNSILPLHLAEICNDKKSEVKEIRDKIQQLSFTMRTIINNNNELSR